MSKFKVGENVKSNGGLGGTQDGVVLEVDATFFKNQVIYKVEFNDGKIHWKNEENLDKFEPKAEQKPPSTSRNVVFVQFERDIAKGVDRKYLFWLPENVNVKKGTRVFTNKLDHMITVTENFILPDKVLNVFMEKLGLEYLTRIDGIVEEVVSTEKRWF